LPRLFFLLGDYLELKNGGPIKHLYTYYI